MMYGMSCTFLLCPCVEQTNHKISLIPVIVLMLGGASSLHDNFDCLTRTLYSIVSLPPQDVVATQDQVPGKK